MLENIIQRAREFPDRSFSKWDTITGDLPFYSSLSAIMFPCFHISSDLSPVRLCEGHRSCSLSRVSVSDTHLAVNDHEMWHIKALLFYKGAILTHYTGDQTQHIHFRAGQRAVQDKNTQSTRSQSNVLMSEPTDGYTISARNEINAALTQLQLQDAHLIFIRVEDLGRLVSQRSCTGKQTTKQIMSRVSILSICV